jgi:NAD(P)-dependent dehydrogenase (short-subunit alcohol dehydrogenase family)
MRLEGKLVVITGAASGLGRELALDLERRNARLALCDVRRAGLEETASLIRQRGGSAIVHAVNVCDRDEVQQWAADVAASHGQVDVLINNAGMTLPWRSILETPYDHLQRIMDVNLWGAIHCTVAFLPQLRERPEAAIVTVASVGGVVAFPQQLGYCMSKFAVRGFAEGLAMELAGTNVHAMVVLPGGLRGTKIMQNALGITADEAAAGDRLQESGMTTPLGHAVSKIVRGIERNRVRVIVGKDARLMAALTRLFPARYGSLLAPLATRFEKIRSQQANPG